VVGELDLVGEIALVDVVVVELADEEGEVIVAVWIVNQLLSSGRRYPLGVTCQRLQPQDLLDRVVGVTWCIMGETVQGDKATRDEAKHASFPRRWISGWRGSIVLRKLSGDFLHGW
jgi:hypothetical protein